MSLWKCITEGMGLIWEGEVKREVRGISGEPIKAKCVTKSYPYCFCFKANGFRMMGELHIQWVFFHCWRNFSLAVAKSINRCQFETGFSLRGEVWVAFWNCSWSTQKSNEENLVRPHFWFSFFLVFILSRCLSLQILCDNFQFDV